MRNIILIFLPISCLFSQNLFSSSGIHISGTNADGPTAVFAKDLDEDGDPDNIEIAIREKIGGIVIAQ